MNEKNLISIGKRTKNEQREITSKGGVMSGKTRRRKRAIKQIVKQFMSAETTDEKLRSILKANGFQDEEMTNAAVLVLSIGKEAFSGNVRAAELLIKLLGDDPDQIRRDKELLLQEELLDLKKSTLNKKTEQITDIEDLKPLADLLNELEEDNELGKDIS